jgi:ubiquinone/menaquinone biosynthesis C-methylase UbiE
MAQNTTAYYDETAAVYEDLHGSEGEHIKALELGWPIIASLNPQSLLDVGCGTGKILRWVANAAPNVELVGIDPSKRLLDFARTNLPQANLQTGDGEHLQFSTQSIDVVAASAIMHHVDRPSVVIDEMFRVARKAVLISDHNNFAFGGFRAQRVRMALYCLGLLDVATFIKQGFKKQGYTKEDGWWYPYSILNNIEQISRLSRVMYVMPTQQATPGLGGNMAFCHAKLSIVAIK